MRGLIEAVYRTVLKVLTTVLNVALVALVVVVLVAVGVRYLGFWPGSLQWTTELSRFAIIWIVMLGAVVGLHRGAHVSVDVGGLFPVSWRGPIRSLGFLLGVGFLAVLAWQGFRLSMETMRQVSPALGLPMGYAYLAIPVGAGLMTLQSILFAVLPDLLGKNDSLPAVAVDEHR